MSCHRPKLTPAPAGAPSGHSASGEKTPGATDSKRNIATLVTISAVVTGTMRPTWGRLVRRPRGCGRVPIDRDRWSFGRREPLRLSSRTERQLLHPPIQQLGDVDLALTRAGDLVHPPKLLRLLAGFTKHPKNLAVQRELVDSSREGIRAEQHLIGSRRDTKRPRRSR